MVLNFSDLNKTQINKIQGRVSSNDEIEIVMSFYYLNVLQSNEHTEDYHIKKANDENFLFEIEDINYIYVGYKVISFETNDNKKIYSAKLGHNDIKYPYAYDEENIYFLIHQKYNTIQEY